MSFKTMIEEERGSFIWVIRNFGAAKGEEIHSPHYKTENMGWVLVLQKGSRIKKSVNENSVSYIVSGDRLNSEPIRAKIRIHVISAANVTTLLLEKVVKVSRGNRVFHKAVLAAETLLNEYLVKGVLTLRLDVAFSKTDGCTTSDPFDDCGFGSEPSRPQSSIETLHADIRSYRSKHDSGDVDLRVEEQVFRVHKFILSARSPVFQRMFENDMKENLTDTVSISDVRAPVLRQMIDYMYGEEVDESSSDTCIGLYAAAEKYCMPDLKQRCARFLEKNLGPDIACEVASMAHLHQDTQLLASATSYISSHSVEVICSKGWVELVTKVPALASDLAGSATSTQ